MLRSIYAIIVGGYDDCAECTDNIAPYISVICTARDTLSGNHDFLIISADVFEQLNHLNSCAVDAMLRGEGLVWLIEAVVCLHAAPCVQLFAGADSMWMAA